MRANVKMWTSGWLLALSFAACGIAAASNGVVGPGNCDESGFDTVLSAVDGSGGGTVTFNCGSAPVTITLGHYTGIANAVTIDGGNRITFDGANTSAWFQIYAGANVTLERLVLKRGAFNASHALEIFGSLTLSGVSILDSTSTESPVVNYGNLVIEGSTFSGNALSGSGSTGGAISNSSGTMRISGSTFTGNSAFDGGAIYLDPGSVSTSITSTSFSDNTSDYGAAIENWGPTLGISASVFENNQAQSGDGGAIWSLQGNVSIDTSQFQGNQATTSGGAISCYGGGLDVSASAFGSNQSAGNGAGIYSQCALNAINVTFDANAAGSAGGGALYQSSSENSTLIFATVAGNSATFGGGIYNDGASAGVLSVGNSIVTANTGGNCDGVFATLGYNLSNDTGCGSAFTGPGDVLNATLTLQAYGDHGGPTSTMPPASGNPAIDHVPDAHCGSPFDQRGGGRPSGPACDSGAVEVGAVLDVIFVDGFD